MAQPENGGYGKIHGGGHGWLALKIIMMTAVILFILFMAFCMVYTVKSAFGLDFFPGLHLKDVVDMIFHFKD